MSRQSTSVQGAALAKRGQGQVDQADPDVKWASVREELIKQTNWFKSLLPTHMSEDAQVRQFLAMCFSVVKESDWQLQRALMEAPQTFFSAAAECAQLGLIPGKTYHFVAFNVTVKEQGGRERKEYQVTGMTDYKGEIDMIYRSGRVRAVHAEVVRANDTFKWRPGMEFPYHVIHAPKPPEGFNEVQEGLASDDERGPLTGVYAYAVMMDGGYSRVSVLSRSRIAKLRSTKTEAFWGPQWPAEGPWTEDMWRKSGVHDLFDEVPHSVEYVLDRLRVQASIAEAPKGVVLPAAPEADVKALDGAPAPDGAQEPDGNPVPPLDPAADLAP